MPPARERNREQECEEHLHAGQRDAQLVQELDQLAIGALLRGLGLLGRNALITHPRARYTALAATERLASQLETEQRRVALLFAQEREEVEA